MKLTSVVLSLLPATALAFPTAGEAPKSMTKRQSATTVTDQLLFSITLPAFETRRNARNPSNLDWSSDGCSSSPDNPFGFPFVPACHRHDFGYRNYKNQARFSDSNRLKIDDNFKKDLYYQCNTVTLSGVCKALADVYYTAVRAFGGSGASKREVDEDALKAYEHAVEVYNQLVKEAQDAGLLPALE
ncbi:Prokaryotic phospholipase A2 domain containing protein [Naviculisporaceae sp. PSN 640]